ncbi:putative permease [Actinoplanes missouriensis 431]|uniref:Putative permease n=1 Tax=Actinoplanes missouriensis (strain ATCC 14538 / DSM 43046 / CBS 188.64 / JCM 3121 / NBRC 102363 / NCIMB 12654 / NRRL B-3342 / UNCC 431) TaxID=512565 RepID=I0H3E0_ACTM4|nr:FtsX-like permease family protein [Actinoplanes missouriensis]BAL87527.1 putative permease [Actinoplanes missouriensis 431]
MKLPLPHWPSVRGRARADAVPLLLTAVVVTVVAALSSAVPVLLRSTADEAVQDAVRRAGSTADVTATARWEEPDDGQNGRIRMPRLADDVTALRERALGELGADLRGALLPPVAGLISPTLKITDGSVLRTLRLAYLSAADGPAVTWTAGQAPGPTAEGFAEMPYFDGPPWTVGIGLSETVAAQLGVRPGDHIPLADEFGDKKDVLVSGVYRPADPADPAWRIAPWLLEPRSGADGIGSTRFGALLSADSLPDARLAFKPDEMRRTVWFSPDPDVLTWQSAERITATAVALKATSASSSAFDASSTWNTQLDAVLRDVRAQIDAATAQASVLLIAVLTVAVLVLLLAAALLVRRRAGALAVARQRGAGLPVLALELVVESAAVTVVAAAAGVGLARTLVSSFWVSPWVVPVIVAGVLAAPVLGVVAAGRATRDRRAPANRSARRQLVRTVQLRRIAGELAVVAVAAGAFAALHQRGVAPGGAVALPAAAPALGVLVGALVLLRVMPAVTGVVLRWALRSRRPLAVFGAARAADGGGRALPLVAVVGAAGLAVFGGVVAGTVDEGLRDGSWRSVGADARIDLAVEGAARDVAGKVAGQDGVSHVAAGWVSDGVRVVTDEVTAVPRLVAVDAAAFRELVGNTPLPDGALLGPLVTAGVPSPQPSSSSGQPSASPSPQSSRTPGDISNISSLPVPALVLSADGSLQPGMKLQLLREDFPAVPLTAVGPAPAIGGAADVVVVDAGALAAAGMPADPNTIWLTGPGAARAAASTGIAADVVTRTDVLRERRDAPLVSGLRHLAWASTGVLLALGVLGFALSAAATAPERWQTLTRLRTIGLRPRDARTVATAELLPLAVLAAIAGPALGVLVAWVTLGPLALRLLTGQSADPLPSLPWTVLGAVAGAFVLVALVIPPVESMIRRRQRLSEVLRVGTP